jgi:hypothetical protein
LIQEKRKQNTKDDKKMISDRGQKKMARFLPLLKRNERKYRYCRSCKFNCRTAKQEQLDARAKILEDRKK